MLTLARGYTLEVSNRLSLKDHRHRRFWTVRELARRADVSPQTIVNIEHGHRPPIQATILKIAGALDVDPMSIREFAQAAGVDVDAQDG